MSLGGLDRSRTSSRIRRREHAAAAIAGHLHAVVADDAGRFIETDRRDLVTPGIDAADAACDRRFDDAVERRLLPDRGSVEGEKLEMLREIAHQVTPPSAITCLIRVAASSGSRRPPDASRPPTSCV